MDVSASRKSRAAAQVHRLVGKIFTFGYLYLYHLYFNGFGGNIIL